MFCFTLSLDNQSNFKLGAGHFSYYPGKTNGSRPGLRGPSPCLNYVIVTETSGISLFTTATDRSVLCCFLYYADREGILPSDQ